MLKILLGILIGLGVTFTGIALARTVTLNQSFPLDHASGLVEKVRDGVVICYVYDGVGAQGGISCLVEPR